MKDCAEYEITDINESRSQLRPHASSSLSIKVQKSPLSLDLAKIHLNNTTPDSSPVQTNATNLSNLSDAALS